MLFLLTRDTSISPHNMSAKRGRTEVREGGTFSVLLGNSSFFVFFFFSERDIHDRHPDLLAKGSECTLEKNFTRENVTNLFGV